MFMEKVISCTNKITAYFFLIYISLILLKALYTRISNVCQQNLYLIFHELFGVLKHVLNYCRVWQKHLVSKYVNSLIQCLWKTTWGPDGNRMCANFVFTTYCVSFSWFILQFPNWVFNFTIEVILAFSFTLQRCILITLVRLMKMKFHVFHNTYSGTFPPATCLGCSFPYSFKDLTIAYFQFSPPSQA